MIFFCIQPDHTMERINSVTGIRIYVAVIKCFAFPDGEKKVSMDSKTEILTGTNNCTTKPTDAQTVAMCSFQPSLSSSESLDED